MNPGGSQDVEWVFCGDAMLGTRRLERNPFEMLEPLLRNADVGFCNLETSLAGPGVPHAKRHIMSTPTENLHYLASAGFHLVNLANNHVLDRGEAAGLKMIEELRNNRLEIVGLDDSGRAKPVLISRKGIRIGFLGYADYGFRSMLMPLRKRVALTDVAALRRKADCVVVSLHWGSEYVELPSPEQQRLARQLIDAGAHIVVGHHPHVFQGIEEYNGGLIAYSLGNCQFRGDFQDEYLSAGTGILLQVQRSPQGRLAYVAFPLICSCSGDVQLASGQQAKLSLRRLAELSDTLRGQEIKHLTWMKEASRVWFPLQLEAWFFRAKRFGATQWLHMFGWLLRPINLIVLLFYLIGPKHPSSRALFQAQDS
jgi:poly-gamma-glutamate synthesis protein (capsule biosynthesis protein)